MTKPREIQAIKKIELSPTQFAFVHSTAIVNVLYSSTGEGKSWAAVFSLLVHAQKNGVPIRCAIVRDTHENIKTSTVRSIQDAFDPYYGPASYRFNNDYKSLTIFSNPRVIVDLFGIDDPASLGKLQGPEYALIWLEEPAPIIERSNSGLAEDVFNAALVRCTRQKGTIGRLNVTMNPADEDHWTYRRFFEDPGIDPENPLITRAVFRIPPGENSNVSELSRQAVRVGYKNDPASLLRYAKGEFAPVYRGKKVTPEFDPKGHVHDAPLIPHPGLVGFRLWDGYFNPTPYDSKTEILTKYDGWKLIKDISVGDVVITLNPKTKEIEYQNIEQKVAREFSGKMYHWKSTHFDLRVTEDHSIIYEKQNSKEISSKKARDIGQRVSVPKFGKWRGLCVADCMVLPEYHNHAVHQEEKRIPIDAFCAFMGIYLSEGSCARYKKRKDDEKVSHCRISVYQKKRDLRIESILEKMPFHWSWKMTGECGGWHTSSMQLYNYLHDFGRSWEKYVPQEIKNLPPDQIKKFLEFYFIGDGADERRIITSSPKMADDIQELALKCGWSATITRKNIAGQTRKINGHDFHCRRDYYVIGFSRKQKTTNLTRKRRTIENLSSPEMVYCVMVPNHIVYVRRNGRPIWCGNCIMGQITQTGRAVFIDSFIIENSDIRVLIETKVLPAMGSLKWKDKCKAWRDIGDFTMMTPDQSNKQEAAGKVIETQLHTIFERGPTKWEIMKIGLGHALRMKNEHGHHMLVINPENRLLIKTLDGAWSYKVDNSGNQTSTIPIKTGLWSHLGDAFANGVNVLFPANEIKIDKEKFKKQRQQMIDRASSYSF